MVRESASAGGIGSGKTTLTNAIAGIHTRIRGDHELTTGTIFGIWTSHLFA